MSTTPTVADAGTAHRPSRRTPTPTRLGGLAAAGLLAANGLVALTASPEQLADHAQGAGRLSELLAGLAFVAAAIALAGTVPGTRAARVWWWTAILSLAASGATMVGVVLVRAEPPLWVFLVTVTPLLVSLVAVGIVGTRNRTWPWWTGLGLALFLPIMFTVPFNSVPMAVVWVLVAVTAHPPRHP